MLLLLVCDKLTTSEDGATQLLVCGALSPANVICQSHHINIWGRVIIINGNDHELH